MASATTRTPSWRPRGNDGTRLKPFFSDAGLSQALDQAAEFHPSEVVGRALRRALTGDAETAVLFAATLMFVHGKADSAFHWDQFLRFATQHRKERKAVFQELCEKIGVDLRSIPPQAACIGRRSRNTPAMAIRKRIPALA
jgi:hypothetical protein